MCPGFIGDNPKIIGKFVLNANKSLLLGMKIPISRILGNNALVRRYDLTYEESTDSKESLLKQITEYGSDATSNPPGTSLPPVSYTYSVGGNNFQSDGTWMNATVHETANDKEIIYLADYSGDGKSDVVYCESNNWYLAISNGSGFNSATQWLNGTSCETSVISLGDFDGDGTNDIALMTDTNFASIYLSTGSTFNFGWNLNFLSGAIKGLFGDFNGDGKTDFSFYVLNQASSCAILFPLYFDGTEDCYVWIVELSTGTGFNQFDDVNPDPSFFWFWYRASLDVEPSWPRVGDFDGNGLSDLVF